MDETFGQALRRLRGSRSLRGVAQLAHCSKSYVWDLETERKQPTPEIAAALDRALGANGELLAFIDNHHDSHEHGKRLSQSRNGQTWATQSSAICDDETEAWELAQRAQASSVGNETLDKLKTAFEDLATAYPVTPPRQLLHRIRIHTGYVAQLLTARITLAQHRKLLMVGGWLSLLGATIHVDLKQQRAATARLQTAAALAREAGNRELEAWCYETDAWQVLTAGDYTAALELARAAQSMAPAGTSALIQATAQEGRALARLDRARETYGAIKRVQDMASTMRLTDRPMEHHYQYDPAKALSYTATTLAWLGDPAAESYAREVISRLGPSVNPENWPRRAATASIDLALVLLVKGRLDEACNAAQTAILSGRVVPSSRWRAHEVVKAVEERSLPEAADLREVYEGLKAAE